MSKILLSPKYAYFVGSISDMLNIFDRHILAIHFSFFSLLMQGISSIFLIKWVKTILSFVDERMALWR